MICRVCRKAADALSAGYITKEEAEFLHSTCNGCSCQHNLEGKLKTNQPERGIHESPEQSVLENIH